MRRQPALVSITFLTNVMLEQQLLSCSVNMYSMLLTQTLSSNSLPWSRCMCHQNPRHRIPLTCLQALAPRQQHCYCSQYSDKSATGVVLLQSKRHFNADNSSVRSYCSTRSSELVVLSAPVFPRFQPSPQHIPAQDEGHLFFGHGFQNIAAHAQMSPLRHTPRQLAAQERSSV